MKIKHLIIILGLTISCQPNQDKEVTASYDNGAPQQELTYINGKTDSLNYDVKQFNEDGTIEMVGRIRNGKQDGLYTWYYPNGNKKWVENFKNGYSVDTTHCYYEQGQIKRIIYPSDNGTRKAIEYYDSGEIKIITFLTNGDFIDSTWTAFYKNRQVKELGNLKTGRRQGVWKFYSDSGQLTDSLDMTGLKKLVFDFEEVEKSEVK